MNNSTLKFQNFSSFTSKVFKLKDSNLYLMISKEPKVYKGYTKKQIFLLLTLMYTNFWEASCYSLQAPFLPQIAQEKGVSSMIYGLIFGILEFVILFTSPIFGMLVSIISPNFLIISGLLVAASNVMLFGILNYSPPGQTFIALAFIIRIFQGLGVSSFFTANYALLAHEFDQKVATVFGILEACFASGSTIGPTFGGLMHQWGGFSLPFIFLGTLLLIGSIIGYFTIPRVVITHKIELRKLLKFMIDFETFVDLLVIASGFTMAGFVSASLEFHLQQFNIRPGLEGFMFVIHGLAYAFSSPIFGKLCQAKIEPKLLALIGCLISSIGVLIIGPFPFFNFKAKLWLTSLSLFVIGIGNSAKTLCSFLSALKTATGRRGFPKNLTTYGIVSGVFFSCSSLGFGLGPTVAGVVLDSIGFEWGTAVLLVVDLTMIFFLSLTLIINLFKKPDNYIEYSDNEKFPILKGSVPDSS